MVGVDLSICERTSIVKQEGSCILGMVRDDLYDTTQPAPNMRSER